MRIIKKGTLQECWEHHPEVEQQLLAWYDDVKKQKWETPADLQSSYSNVRILPDKRAVFNIKGNKFRLVVRIQYDLGWVYIRFIGTHKKYDEIDATTI